MTTLDIATIPYVREIARPGEDHRGRTLDELERSIIQAVDLRERTLRSIQTSRREIDGIGDYHDHHLPGMLRKVLVPKEPGNYRETWSPSNHDFVQGTMRNEAFTKPLLRTLAHESTHGFRQGRSHGTALDEILRILASEGGVVMQTDIEECFPTLAFQHLRGSTLRGRLESYICHLHHRFRQAVKGKGPIGQGLPAGHPIAPAIAVLAIDEILRPIRTRWTEAKVIAYADDLTIVAPNLKYAGTVLLEVEQALRRHGMKLNAKKTRATNPDSGSKTEILGFEIDWANGYANPIIRPKKKAFERLTEKISAAENAPTISRIIRGWSRAYRRCNDPDFPLRRGEAIQEGHARRADR